MAHTSWGKPATTVTTKMIIKNLIHQGTKLVETYLYIIFHLYLSKEYISFISV